MKVRRNKRKGIWWMLLLFVSAIICTPLGETCAATSYTNAREFYESTGQDSNGQHIEVQNGYLYYATNAKVASSSTNLKYTTVGYDITLMGNGVNLDISVKRDETLGEVPNSSVEYGGYQYLLYRISYEQIQHLANEKNPIVAEKILESSIVTVKMNAIITSKNGKNQNGDISENGNGTLNEWGTIYHLKESEDLEIARRIFSGHTFDSYRNIVQSMPNYTLNIRYKLHGGAVGNGYTSHEDLLYQNGKSFTTSAKQMQKLSLKSPDDIALTKAGYHIDTKNDWIYRNTCYSSSDTYMPVQIKPDIAAGNKNITMEANWIPNTYAIAYDSNGGKGYMMDSGFTYDTAGKLRPLGYTRNGYTFRGWNTVRDGSGALYSDQQSILNLTEEQGKIVMLYAQWEETVFTITADKQSGAGGTDTFYEKYAKGWYGNQGGTYPIDVISIPQKKGYAFGGYFTGLLGFGTGIIGKTGSILAKPDYFDRDSMVYGSWKPNQYTLTFDKQGGTGGTDTADVTYDVSLPEATAPIRQGHTFQGYYTQTGGKGTQYYNEAMIGLQQYRVDGNLTLYAHWIDKTPPEIALNTNIEIWTKETVVLSAAASDTGSGLSSVTIYQGNKKVAEKNGLNGAKTYTLPFQNSTEGALSYKAVVIDMSGNKAEAYKTIYFDRTAPKGKVISENQFGTSLEAEVFVTDYKVGD